MSLPGPFLAGQRLTAGQLNDATQKTLDSVSVSVAGGIGTTSGTTELNIPRLALGPVPLVAGGLYRFQIRAILSVTNNLDAFSMIIRRDTALTGTVISEVLLGAKDPTAGYGFTVAPWVDMPAVLTEPSVSFFFSLKRNLSTGGGTMTIFGQTAVAARSGTAIVRVGYSSEYRVSS